MKKAYLKGRREIYASDRDSRFDLINHIKTSFLCYGRGDIINGDLLYDETYFYDFNDKIILSNNHIKHTSYGPIRLGFAVVPPILDDIIKSDEYLTRLLIARLRGDKVFIIIAPTSSTTNAAIIANKYSKSMDYHDIIDVDSIIRRDIPQGDLYMSGDPDVLYDYIRRLPKATINLVSSYFHAECLASKNDLILHVTGLEYVNSDSELVEYEKDDSYEAIKDSVPLRSRIEIDNHRSFIKKGLKGVNHEALSELLQNYFSYVRTAEYDVLEDGLSVGLYSLPPIRSSISAGYIFKTNLNIFITRDGVIHNYLNLNDMKEVMNFKNTLREFACNGATLSMIPIDLYGDWFKTYAQMIHKNFMNHKEPIPFYDKWQVFIRSKHYQDANAFDVVALSVYSTMEIIKHKLIILDRLHITFEHTNNLSKVFRSRFKYPKAGHTIGIILGCSPLLFKNQMMYMAHDLSHAAPITVKDGINTVLYQVQAHKKSEYFDALKSLSEWSKGGYENELFDTYMDLNFLCIGDFKLEVKNRADLGLYILDRFDPNTTWPLNMTMLQDFSTLLSKYMR